MLSEDAMVQASATMTVGIIFLMTLRQALDLRITRSFLFKLILPTAAFFFCAFFAVFGESHAEPSWIEASGYLFILGLMTVSSVVASLQTELEE
jgi:threonine/homoserine/homoserine lactone efflux protein